MSAIAVAPMRPDAGRNTTIEVIMRNYEDKAIFNVQRHVGERLTTCTGKPAGVYKRTKKAAHTLPGKCVTIKIK